MTAVKSVSAKPLTGFEKKKTLEHFGCEFSKEGDPAEWVVRFEGQIIGKDRLQIEAVNAAIEALGGE
uniref:Uncharacterized protein n=1 Tax=Pseudomonas phage Nican01 TaxID=3138540 RepID=A0AAU6W1K3_9CAUD